MDWTFALKKMLLKKEPERSKVTFATIFGQRSAPMSVLVCTGTANSGGVRAAAQCSDSLAPSLVDWSAAGFVEAPVKSGSRDAVRDGLSLNSERATMRVATAPV